MTFRRCVKPLGTFAATVLVGLTALSAAETNELVREQRPVVVHGVHETWRLEWAAPPESVCGAEDVAAAQTCACAGYAYGEAGALSLVRRRPGAPIERLSLSSFYKNGALPDAKGLALIQHWPPIPPTAHNEDDDWHHASDWNFLKRVQARTPTEVMRFADYNHDGAANEFLLQVDTQPCGTAAYVLVGVSRANPQLHVFASAEAPDTPLELSAKAWEMARRNAGPVEIVDSPCAEGTSTETVVTVTVRRGVFQVRRDVRSCGPGENPDTPP